MFSDDEKLVLSHFFTNLDKPVFAAKNFHPEVWALMQARYSRGTEGMRESFLSLMKEDPANFQAMVSVLKDRPSQLKMDHAVEKAIKFMDKWVLGFGHSSVAEGATIGFGLEGVSILATKVIEDNRLCSYIEKSTRYVSFDRDSFYIGPELKKYGRDVEQTVDMLFQTYKDLHEPVLDHILKSVPLATGQNEAAWKRSCAARRFDAVRYLLPACTKTSLGWTLNARSLAHAISKLSSSPLPEMQELGLMLKEEGRKVLPSLLKYADAKPYFVETDKTMRELYGASTEKQEKQNSVKLVSSPAAIDDEILAAILFRYSSESYEQAKEKAAAMTQAEKEKAFDNYLSKMADFDSPMRELEYADFTFEVLMDYGSFRDVQRHRICTQTNQLLTCFNGYETPEDIVNAGYRRQYDEAMKQARETFDLVYADSPQLSQYVVPLGYRHRFLFKANLRELYHFIKLRSTPQGHVSYRRVAQQMYSRIKEKNPLAAKYLQCHFDETELGRLKAETSFEEKVRKGLV